MSCPWGAIFWYRSVCPVQPLWLFSRLFFFASLTCVPHKRHQQQPWCFFNFDLSQHSGLMCLGGGPLVPSSLSSLSSEDMNSTALCRFHKAFILALSSGESWALSNNSVRYYSEHQKNSFIVTVAWLIWKTLTLTFFFNNSLVWQ